MEISMTNNNKKNDYDNFKFLPEYYNYFILIDGSAQENKIPFIVYQIEQNPHIEPLFLHTPYEALQLSGPLLIQVTRNSPLLRWYFANSNGEAGILLYATRTIDLAELAAHLRPYIEAVLPSGKTMLFRFYDPRNFCCFWPSLDSGERNFFLGPATGVVYPEPNAQTGARWHHDRIDPRDSSLPPNIKKHPWVVSDATYAAMREPFLYSMGKRMAGNFREFYPSRARMLKKNCLQAFGDLVVAKGFGMGCRAESELNCLMICMAQLGSFFDTDPQYSWSSLKLQHGETADDRLKQISDTIAEMHKTLWGNLGLPYQRALRAVYEAISWNDLDKVKDREQALFVLQQFYREKACFQGKRGLEAIFDLAEVKGQKYGIQSVKGYFILSVIFFFLGSSADKDPLYPWIGDILRKQCGEEEKLRALFDMGRKRARSEYLAQRKLTGVALYDNIRKACAFVRYASIAELSAPLEELLKRFSLPLDPECIAKCRRGAAKFFPEAEHFIPYSVCVMALWFRENYPSPAGAELYAILESSSQRTLKDSNSAVEKWLRDNVASLETMITHHILTLGN